MDINELIELKKEYQATYNLELAEMKSASTTEEQKVLFRDILADLTREMDKIDSLMEIYKYSEPEIVVMKLERLYMMNMYGMSEGEYNSLNMDKKFSLFSMCFPQEWVVINNLKEKENLLLNAISNNKMINFEEEKGMKY